MRGHQCLSAGGHEARDKLVSAVHWTDVTNAFRREGTRPGCPRGGGGLVPVVTNAFRREGTRPVKPEDTRTLKSCCHQCLSAGGHEARAILLVGGTTFAGHQCLSAGGHEAHKVSWSGPSVRTGHQCLSAGGHEALASTLVVDRWGMVTNAFRREGTRPWDRDVCHDRIPSPSPMPFGGRARGPKPEASPFTNEKRSPMPFGGRARGPLASVTTCR